MRRLEELIAHARKNGHKIHYTYVSARGQYLVERRKGGRIGTFKNEEDAEAIDEICFKIESFCFLQA